MEGGGGTDTRKVGGKDGQEQLVSRHWGWAARGWGLLILQILTAHSSRPAFRVSKPGFLLCGSTLGMTPGKSAILGDGGWCGVPQGRKLLKEMGE